MKQLEEMEEKQLINDIREGRKPFEEAIRQYERFLWQKVHTYKIVEYENEDLYSVVLASLHKSIQTYNGSVKFTTYLGCLIDNDLAMLIRKAQSVRKGAVNYQQCVRLNQQVSWDGGKPIERGELLQSPYTSDEGARKSDLQRHINDCLNELTDVERMCILWLIHKDETQITMAKRLGVRQPTFSRMVERSRKKLVHKLTKRGIDCNYLQ